MTTYTAEQIYDKLNQIRDREEALALLRSVMSPGPGVGSLTYKIRLSDGLYSDGGMYIRSSKRGKRWEELDHLRKHIALTLKNHFDPVGWEDSEGADPRPPHPYENAEVIVQRITTDAHRDVSLRDLVESQAEIVAAEWRERSHRHRSCGEEAWSRAYTRRAEAIERWAARLATS